MARPRTRRTDWGYHWLPKIIGDHSHLVTSYAMLDGKVKGYFLFGQNPAAGSTNARMQRKALAAIGLDGRARSLRG